MNLVLDLRIDFRGLGGAINDRIGKISHGKRWWGVNDKGWALPGMNIENGQYPKIKKILKIWF